MADARRREAEANQQQQEMQQQQSMLEAQERAKQEVIAWEMKKHQDEMAMKKYYADKEAEKFERMNDVDANNKSDALESKEIEMIFNSQEEEKNRKLELEMHKDKMEIERMKISAIKNSPKKK